MEIRKWIEESIAKGLVCDEYTTKYTDAKSKKQLVDLVLRGGGVGYLCQAQANGFLPDYSVLEKEFAPFINGKYISYGDVSNDDYSSSIYVCFEGQLNADTTAVTLLGCKCDVHINSFDCVHLFIDGNTKVNVYCPATSQCYVEVWGEGVINKFGNARGIYIKKKL